MANQQETLRELALFAGAGGGILGGKLLGWRTVCAVEWDAYAASVLVARQNDGCLDPFPIWDDVQDFDGRPWRGCVDVVSGGFPCQDISCAGKGAGIDGERSGMWKEFARIIGEVRPRFVFVENSPMLTVRGLGTVLGDLASLGYDARWGVLGACDAGAPHRRERIWLLCSDASRVRREFGGRNWGKGHILPHENGITKKGKSEWGRRISGIGASGSDVADAKGVYAQGQHNGQREVKSRRSGWWEVEPRLDRVADGMANRVDRLKSIGNGQVPSVAKLAWETLKEET
jgi:DNA (cytosine-5)-methyltransferase 1